MDKSLQAGHQMESLKAIGTVACSEGSKMPEHRQVQWIALYKDIIQHNTT